MTNLTDMDRSFLNVLPVISTAMGMVSVALGLMAVRTGIAQQRAYTQDEKYLVSVRYIGQWNDIRDFVQPADPEVITNCNLYGPDYWSLFDFVCRNISYRRDIGEFFQFPAETLNSGTGDCEDTTNLLTSLLRNFVPTYSVLGSYCGYGHAWCQTQRQLLETTFSQARSTPDPQNYFPYVYYDEDSVVELWPGALSELFAVPRNETRKLSLIARAAGNHV